MNRALFICRLYLAAAFCAAASAGCQSARPQFAARPPERRLFVSPAVEAEIAEVRAKLRNPKLAAMFAACYPNTLDTTVHYRVRNGEDDTFVVTGDIPAMWLRDSSAQVWPYLRFAARDDALRRMIRGVLLRQFACVRCDPYANAFNDGPTGARWTRDITDQRPEVWERKWELDSLAACLRLADGYWRATRDDSVFRTGAWSAALRRIVATCREQQRRTGDGPYHFQRLTTAPTETLGRGGFGPPVRPCGLVVSSFRPSDDASTLPFHVPANLMMARYLRAAAGIVRDVNADELLARECESLAAEIEEAIRREAICELPGTGRVLAYEVDGFGGRVIMDDANIPDLLSLPYFGILPADDPVYRNTRRLVLGSGNPWFCKGRCAEGLGSPHTGPGQVWPLALIMRAMTSDDDAEIAACLRALLATEAGTGFMHESFDADDPARFSRPWFAWADSLFGELIIRLIDEGKLPLLNSL